MLKRKPVRILLYVLAALVVITAALYIYYKVATRVAEPGISSILQPSGERIQTGPGEYTCKNGWLRNAGDGWWEMYLEGSPYEIGYAHGLLTKELMYGQEKAFLGRLAELIPSKTYQDFMLGFVRFFNRDLDEYVLPQFRQEIFGISRFASPEFDFMGPAYARMLNYHAAHDLGHAVQNMNLVACTAFGAWGSRSADSALILGRNFDFYISDDFAKNKILCFVRPDSGYSFVSVTWAGFAGVVSGMNEKGLTVTLNAAKSSVPFSAKTPVSLLAREILQYASDISEAYAIAQKRQTFVAESFLIGSAADHKAVVIEKSPDKISIYDPGDDQLIVTNHFQSNAFLDDELNLENIQNETSVYRLRRTGELLSSVPAVTPACAAAILRDSKGLRGRDIGLGNEKAVNQFIAHHSIIFQPEKRRLWVACPPWQLGEFRCYDMDSVFINGLNVHSSRDAIFCVSTNAKYCVSTEQAIPADSLQLATIYRNLLKYRALATRIELGKYAEGDADSLILCNPEFFQTYRILGNYFRAKGDETRAAEYFRIASEKEAPSAAERKMIILDRR